MCGLSGCGSHWDRKPQNQLTVSRVELAAAHSRLAGATIVDADNLWPVVNLVVKIRPPTIAQQKSIKNGAQIAAFKQESVQDPPAPAEP